jgi:sugar phosphate isomerase/epimerase
MTKVFARASVEETAEAVRRAGLEAVQLNLEAAGLEPLPADLPRELCRRVREAFAARGIEISAVSGTFNAIHPDRGRRAECLRRAGLLASRCDDLGTRVITLCTGTRSEESMWTDHPGNRLPGAWEEMRETLGALAAHGEREGVRMAFEPEVVNVVDTAEKAERILAEIASPALAVVMDPANYFHPAMLPRMDEVLEDAFRRVGGRIALAHAKDVQPPPPGAEECVRPAAGTGLLNYPLYLRLLEQHGYTGGLIMHSLAEHEVPASARLIRGDLLGQEVWRSVGL